MGTSARELTAFITGASYGVGTSTALALAEGGFNIAISATRAENLQVTLAVVEAKGAPVLPVVLDLRTASSITQAVQDVAARFGHVDLLVNNAAINLRKPAVDVIWEEWDEVMAINLRGAFFLSQQIARRMIGSGRPGAIINIASVHGLLGASERSVYGIAKGGLIQMTRMLAVEWAGHGIRVNALAPGRLETASPSRAVRTTDPAYLESMRARIPLKQLATAEQVAAAVCYLASPQASTITGQTLVLDGGMSIV
jgi:2-deoxy-D-gluconate 3-dehydrogenase